MVDWFTGLKAAEIVLGWIAGAISALIGLFWWLDKRVDSKVKTAGLNGVAAGERLVSVDRELKEFDDRLRRIELALAGLPTAKELSDVRVELAAIGALVKASAEQVDTLYNAALRADRRGGS